MSQGALDLQSCENDLSSTQIWVKKGQHEYLLATLSKEIPQAKIELAIGSDEEIAFYTVGEGNVHLTGFYIPERKTDEQPQVDHVEVERNNSDKLVEETLEEGVVVKDVVRGKGKRVKHGDTVRIFFENKLASNNNIVGRKQTDDGLQMKLGDQNDSSTIRAWHIGIVGMRKGGKRIITCPPNTAYGEAGLSFMIPPNSIIISEVQLIWREKTHSEE